MSSFLVVAGPDEPVGRPYLSIIVFGADSAGVNAVDFLHTKFSEWKASGGPKNRRSRMDYQPPAPPDSVGSSSRRDPGDERVPRRS